MKKKVLAIYYSQTGQSKKILDSILGPLMNNKAIELTVEQLRPLPKFPFPWPAKDFMQVFPESVQGIPCKLATFTLDIHADYDLIFLIWQPWYLSPSIPIHSFLRSEAARTILSGKPVITITGCRNMWIMGHEDILTYLKQIGADLVGKIALVDRSPHLLSIISILRWLILGKKGPFLKGIASAGVSDQDIRSARRFGDIICASIRLGTYHQMQKKLVKLGAVRIYPSILNMEKTGKRIFKKWAAFVLKKGPYGSSNRALRLTCFKYYLLLVIFLVSPVVSMLTLLYCFLRKDKVKDEIERYSLISNYAG
jgi:hypothetical protein